MNESEQIEHALVAFRQQLAERPSSAGSATSWLNAPLWALAGFLCGAVFWHFVGFWDFVGGIVFRGPGDGAAPIATTNGGVDCLTLILDRDNGTTHAEPCPALIAKLPESQRNYKGSLTLEARHRLVRPERWAVTVNDGQEASEQLSR